MEDKNTRALIKLYRRTRSNKAISILMVNHQNALHTIALSLPKNIFSWDEIISYGNEFLFEAIEKKFDLRRKIKFVTYLISKGKFYIIDKMRSFKRVKVNREENRVVIQIDNSFDETYHSPTSDCTTECEKKDELYYLEKAIAKLPRTEQIIIGCVYQGTKQKDLAMQLGVSVARVSQIYNSGLKKLRNYLK